MEETPVCPVCEDEMRLRFSKYGSFWGCASYPACLGKLTLEEVRSMPKEKGFSRLAYKKYLKSKKWKRFKERYRKSQYYTGKCFICGSTYNLHYHHRTYKRLGHERLGDVTLLCPQHHDRVHQLLEENTNPRINLWNIISKLKLGEKYKKHGCI